MQTNPPPHSGWDTLIGIGIVAGAIAILWLLNRLALHYFPSLRKVRTAGGNALMRLDAAFLPGRRENIVEAKERDDAEQDEQGDPPQAGRTPKRPGDQI